MLLGTGMQCHRLFLETCRTCSKVLSPSFKLQALYQLLRVVLPAAIFARVKRCSGRC